MAELGLNAYSGTRMSLDTLFTDWDNTGGEGVNPLYRVASFAAKVVGRVIDPIGAPSVREVSGGDITPRTLGPERYAAIVTRPQVVMVGEAFGAPHVPAVV